MGCTKKSRFCWLLVLGLMLAIFCGCVAKERITYAAGDLANGGFEDGLKEFWSISGTTQAVTIDQVCCYEGTAGVTIGGAEAYNVALTQYIEGLAPGYYYLEAYARNEGNQNYCYVYGNGTGQGKCMTAVPVTNHTQAWTKVTVRGIQVGADGILEIGMCADGEGQYVHFDALSLHYEKDQEKQYEALFGGAVSWLDWVEDLGGKYWRTDGTEADALQIMAENGCNFVRLELYNNPGDYINEYGDMFPEGYKDADAIFDLAVRAHNKGMKIQLSFMYSDCWGNGAIPSDWLAAIEGVTDEAEITAILTDCLYRYTLDFMERLAAAGIYPEYVSLGNEMEGGILTPYGLTYPDDGDLSAFRSFMDAGYRAVKEVSPESQVVLHISCNAEDMFWEGKSGMGMWFFGLCEENHIAYDVIGISFYPFWAQNRSQYAVKNALNTEDLVQWCDMMIDTFDKDILIMESGYNWGKPGQLSNNGAYAGIYPSTPEGQRDFMFELLNAIKCVKDGRCVGSLYWDPVLVKQEGIGYAIMSENGQARPNVVETTTFFDYDHVALPVLNAYKYNTAGSGDGVLYGTVTCADGKPLAEETVVLRFGETDYTVTTDRYGDYYLRVPAGSGTVTLDGQDGTKLTLLPGAEARLDWSLGSARTG